MRFLSLVATLAAASLSIASLMACAADSSEAPAAEPATDDGASEEIKASVIDESGANKTINVPLGTSFTIALSNVESSHATWSVKSVDKTLGQPKMTVLPGSPGTTKFTWSTKSPLDLLGKHTIVLLHSHVGAANTLFTVTIDIIDTSAAPTCGGVAGLKCSPTSYCEYASGAKCGQADATGTCSTKPAFCPAVMLRVCGCDGRTYNNSCLANVAGVSVVSTGACGVRCGNTTCGTGLVCCNPIAGICTLPGKACIQ